MSRGPTLQTREQRRRRSRGVPATGAAAARQAVPGRRKLGHTPLAVMQLRCRCARVGRRAVARREAGAFGEWSAEELFAGAGQGLGVFRLTGSARVGDEFQQRSVILKVLRTRVRRRRPPGAFPGASRSPTTRACWGPSHTVCALRAVSGTRGRHHLWLEDRALRRFSVEAERLRARSAATGALQRRLSRAASPTRRGVAESRPGCARGGPPPRR